MVCLLYRVAAIYIYLYIPRYLVPDTGTKV